MMDELVTVVTDDPAHSCDCHVIIEVLGPYHTYTFENCDKNEWRLLGDWYVPCPGCQSEYQLSQRCVIDRLDTLQMPPISQNHHLFRVFLVGQLLYINIEWPTL